MDRPTSIDTHRLHLRPLRRDDIDDFARLSADEDVMRYIGLGGTQPRDEAERVLDWFVDHWDKHGFGNWALIDPDSGNFVGRGGLNFTGGGDALPKSVEVAYVLDKPYWGRGLATEVARTSVHWGFTWLDVEQIVGLAHVPNIASHRVLEKAGLRKDRTIVLRDVPFVVFTVDRPAQV